MSEQPTVDVRTEHSDEYGYDPAWVRYRWMCSECGATDLADSSPDARADGNQHLVDQHGHPANKA